jgi:hypothetical protein
MTELEQAKSELDESKGSAPIGRGFENSPHRGARQRF